MKEIGKPIHISRTGLLIMKTLKAPRIGSKIFDRKSNFVGTVIDVFGPVPTPYVSVKPRVRRPEKLIGCMLYE